MNGVIIVDKEKDYTSRDIVNVVSKAVGTKKVGHTGTLDPLATGVLAICVGSGTKLVEILTCNDKEYIAEIVLGIKTDTGDVTGNILESKDVKIDKETIIKTLESFKKKYDQTVPIYSAVRIDGKKLYEYARENIEIDLPSREVNIKNIELIDDIRYENNKTIFSFVCDVSKGTYIRSLIEDIASSLNTVGSMSNLRRIKQGIFEIEQSNTLDDIKNNNYKIISIEEVLKNYYTVLLDEELEFKVKNGVKIKNIYNQDIVVFKKEEKVLAIYKDDNGILRMWKMFNNQISL